MQEHIRHILEAATRAPSADNTQPWRVSISGEVLSLFHVPERDMTPYDSGQRTSYISHGAFVANLRVAAASLGRGCVVTFTSPSLENNWLVARIQIQEEGTNDPRLAKLAPAIIERATNRRPYRRQNLPKEIQEALIESDPSVHIVDAPQQKLIRAASLSGELMFGNDFVYKGLFEHIRWKKKDAEEHPDGFLIDTFELPLPARIVFWLMRSKKRRDWLNAKLNLAQKSSPGMEGLFQRSGSFIALTLKTRSPEDYFLLGMRMERLWLTATNKGVALQPIGAICFFKDMLDAGTTQALSDTEQKLVEKAYRDITEAFPLTEDEHVVFLFRAGFAKPPTARTNRLPLSKILLG